MALKGDEFVEIFSSVIFQIAVLFSFIFIGFTIRQGGFLPENSAEIFSKLENRILMPAVVINTFRTNCTVKNISEKWVFIAYSTGVLLFCIATGFAVSRFLGKTEYLKKVYRYSISVSNFGFVGTAMVSGIYGAESMELFDYLMFTLPLNLFTYSIGIAWLVPNGHGKFSMKNFVTEHIMLWLQYALFSIVFILLIHFCGLAAFYIVSAFCGFIPHTLKHLQ